MDPRFGLRQRWIRKGRWAASVLETGKVVLYDIKADPKMTTDRSKEEPVLCAELHALAMKSFQRESANIPTPEQEADLQKKLKSLGYMEK